uniref:Uncharacterized protein n=1 Tax=Arion vulgaris TaxID=1028688 RepID=A0A0B7A9I7_9EUPU
MVSMFSAQLTLKKNVVRISHGSAYFQMIADLRIGEIECLVLSETDNKTEVLCSG